MCCLFINIHIPVGVPKKWVCVYMRMEKFIVVWSLQTSSDEQQYGGGGCLEWVKSGADNKFDFSTDAVNLWSGERRMPIARESIE